MVGYLRAGELYIIRFNYRDAIDIYKEGYESVQKEEDRVLLKQRYEEAEAKLEQRFDIITNVPVEISSDIVQYIKLQDQISMFKVSKTWRQNLSSCNTVWKTISINRSNCPAKKNLSWRRYKKGNLPLLLMCTGHHITKLDLKSLNAQLCKEIFDVMMTHSFDNLKSFSMIGKYQFF